MKRDRPIRRRDHIAAVYDAAIHITPFPTTAEGPSPDPDKVFDRIRGGGFEMRLHKGFEIWGRGEDDSQRQGR